MSDAESVLNNQQSQGAQGAVGAEGSGKSPFPGYVTGILNKETQEALRTEFANDPSVVERLPKDPSALFNEYRSLQSRLKTAVQVPGKDATDEQKAAYRKSMGIPDTVDGYTFDNSFIPREMYDQNFESWFKKAAFNHGVPLETARALYKEYNETLLSAQQTANQKKAQEVQAAEANRAKAYTEAVSKMQAEWGGKYSERMAAAVAAFKNDAIIQPELRQALVAAGLDNNTGVIRLMDIVARATQSDRRIGLSSEAGEAQRKRGFDYGKSFEERYAARSR